MNMNWEDYIHHMFFILHTKPYVAPWGAAPVTLLSGAGAYNFGAFSADIIAAGAIAYDMHIETVIIGKTTAAANYEISLVYGPTDIEIAQISFTGIKNTSDSIPKFTEEIPAGSRIRARMRDSLGASSAEIKIGYHLHPQGF